MNANDVFGESETPVEPLLNEILLDRPANAFFVSVTFLNPENPEKPLNVLPAQEAGKSVVTFLQTARFIGLRHFVKDGTHSFQKTTLLSPSDTRTQLITPEHVGILIGQL